MNETKSPCQPYCPFLNEPAPPDEVPICDTCGTCWILRDVTEVDPVTFLPTRTQRAWTQL